MFYGKCQNYNYQIILIILIKFIVGTNIKEEHSQVIFLSFQVLMILCEFGNFIFKCINILNSHFLTYIKDSFRCKIKPIDILSLINYVLLDRNSNYVKKSAIDGLLFTSSAALGKLCFYIYKINLPQISQIH